MALFKSALKIKLLLIAGVVSVVGLIIFYISIPISTTYLVNDVKPVQSSVDYKIQFMSLVSDGFEESVKDLNKPIGSMREKVVQVALSQVGTREIGGNTNNIKYNDWYRPMHTWLTGRDEYCAIFTQWCFNEIGMYQTNNQGPPLIDSAGCTELACGYMKYGRFVYGTSSYTPRPGDLILFTKWVPARNEVGYRSNHIGIVVDVDDNYVYTVEGNTSIPSGEFQAAGNGVYTKKHARPKTGSSSNILGFGVPWYEGEEEFMTVDGQPY